jgi:hypothetical protein
VTLFPRSSKLRITKLVTLGPLIGLGGPDTLVLPDKTAIFKPDDIVVVDNDRQHRNKQTTFRRIQTP